MAPNLARNRREWRRIRANKGGGLGPIFSSFLRVLQTFANNRERASGARRVVNWFHDIYQQLRLNGCSSHSGRRTFITQTARAVSKAGGSLRDVQELAGHRALSTTERYIEGDRDAQRKLIAML